MLNTKKLLGILTLTTICSTGLFSAEEVNNFVPIAPGIKSIEINLNGEKFTLMRNQSKTNKISSLYNITFRGIPQPIKLHKDIETIGELEFIDYMKKAQTDDSISIIDSRKPGWYERLRIPGAINVPFTNFNNREDALDVMEDYMGVTENKDETFNFENAKTLVVYCNGYWCGQTPAMVKNAEFSLLKIGYPAQKIKYYRGGMQAWTSMGFTVVGSGK